MKKKMGWDVGEGVECGVGAREIHWSCWMCQFRWTDRVYATFGVTEMCKFRCTDWVYRPGRTDFGVTELRRFTIRDQPYNVNIFNGWD